MHREMIGRCGGVALSGLSLASSCLLAGECELNYPPVCSDGEEVEEVEEDAGIDNLIKAAISEVRRALSGGRS